MNRVLVERHCEECDEPLAPTARSDARFCSKQCHGRELWRRTGGAKLLEQKRGRPCDGCGGEIPVTRYGNARYCAEECRVEHVGATIKRRYLLKAKYGLTLEAFDAMLADQDRRCAICASDEPGVKGWQVDHCHDSGTVRGILCPNCNNGLGRFKDRPDSLRRAADYLELDRSVA